MVYVRGQKGSKWKQFKKKKKFTKFFLPKQKSEGPTGSEVRVMNSIIIMTAAKNQSFQSPSQLITYILESE